MNLCSLINMSRSSFLQMLKMNTGSQLIECKCTKHSVFGWVKCVMFKDTGLFKSCMIFLIGVELLCNVMFASGVPQKDSVISSVQSLSHVRLLPTPWTAACQASLSITNSRSWLKLLSIESVMMHHRMYMTAICVHISRLSCTSLPALCPTHLGCES